MVNNKYQWLFFDLDGTLFDYERSEAHALEQTLQMMGIDFQDEYLQMYRDVNAVVWSKIEDNSISFNELKKVRTQMFFEALGFSLKGFDFSELYLENLGQTKYVISDAIEVLDQLCKNHSCAAITNGLSKVQRTRLRLSSLEKYFNEIIISEEIGVAKPDKGFFEYTMQKIDFTNKEKILVIGDSLKSDILGGNQSGICSCWFNPRYLENKTNIIPDYEIQSLTQLEKII